MRAGSRMWRRQLAPRSARSPPLLPRDRSPGSPRENGPRVDAPPGSGPGHLAAAQLLHHQDNQRPELLGRQRLQEGPKRLLAGTRPRRTQDLDVHLEIRRGRDRAQPGSHQTRGLARLRQSRRSAGSRGPGASIAMPGNSRDRGCPPPPFPATGLHPERAASPRGWTDLRLHTNGHQQEGLRLRVPQGGLLCIRRWLENRRWRQSLQPPASSAEAADAGQAVAPTGVIHMPPPDPAAFRTAPRRPGGGGNIMGGGPGGNFGFGNPGCHAG